MAIPQKVQNRTDEIVAACKTAKDVSLGDRDDFIAIMMEACEGTNGLTPEEKLQANSVNLANLCYLFIRDKLEGRPAGFWPALFRLIERCKWQITIIVLGAFALLAYRPQIAQLIEHLTQK
jgi:hypothetical protein